MIASVSDSQQCFDDLLTFALDSRHQISHEHELVIRGHPKMVSYFRKVTHSKRKSVRVRKFHTGPGRVGVGLGKT